MYMLSFKPEFSSSKNLLPLFFMVFLEVWLHPKLEKTLKVSRGKISFLRSFSRNAILRLFRNHSVLVLNLKHTQSLSYFVNFFSQALKKVFYARKSESFDIQGIWKLGVYRVAREGSFFDVDNFKVQTLPPSPCKFWPLGKSVWNS